MNIKSVAHVCIKSADLDATAKFYCDTLGLKRIFNFTRKGKIIGFYMKTGNETFVEVFLTDEIKTLDKQALDHLCLETDSIEDLRKRIIAGGYTPREITMGADNSYQFWMHDPNGMNMEFQQYTPKSAQLVPHDVEVNW